MRLWKLIIDQIFSLSSVSTLSHFRSFSPRCPCTEIIFHCCHKFWHNFPSCDYPTANTSSHETNESKYFLLNFSFLLVVVPPSKIVLKFASREYYCAQYERGKVSLSIYHIRLHIKWGRDENIFLPVSRLSRWDKIDEIILQHNHPRVSFWRFSSWCEGRFYRFLLLLSFLEF